MRYSHRHPGILSSLTFVRTGPELEEDSLISSFALFTVTSFGNSGASFAMHHARFDLVQNREAIIADVCRLIPRNAELLVRQPWSEYLQARIDNPSNGLPLLDNGRLASASPGTTLLPVYCCDDQITTSGEALGLAMPGPRSTPLQRQRRAPLEAIALWGIYLRSFSSRREARHLTAALQAWQLLERVKRTPRR